MRTVLALALIVVYAIVAGGAGSTLAQHSPISPLPTPRPYWPWDVAISGVTCLSPGVVRVHYTLSNVPPVDDYGAVQSSVTRPDGVMVNTSAGASSSNGGVVHYTSELPGSDGVWTVHMALLYVDGELRSANAVGAQFVVSGCAPVIIADPPVSQDAPSTDEHHPEPAYILLPETGAEK